MTTAGRAALAFALTAVALAGCGMGATTTSAQEYCALSADLDAQTEPPSEEQLADIQAAAPAEIADDVATLAEAVRNQDLGGPDTAEAEQSLLAWEQENCAEFAQPESGATAAGATDPVTP